ncbi:hypothetical protein [Streptomyces venezuelae]|uniref:hypothetical protein n=1 Tax=Streptomyces venezuelae TaxID=54571 RepID=UPI0037B7D940
MVTDSSAYAPGPGRGPGPDAGPGSGPRPEPGHRFGGGAVAVRSRHGQAARAGGPTLFLLMRVGGGRPVAGPTRRAW